MAKRVVIKADGIYGDDGNLLKLTPQSISAVKRGKVTNAVKKHLGCSPGDEVFIVDKRPAAKDGEWGVCFNSAGEVTLERRFQTSLEADDVCDEFNASRLYNGPSRYEVRKFVGGKWVLPVL